MGQYAAGWPMQYLVNLQRCLLAQLRNPTDSAMRLLISMWVGLLAGVHLFLYRLVHTCGCVRAFGRTCVC